MKKLVALFLCLMLLCAAACAEETHGNYTDEMKLDYAVDLSAEDGADSMEREGDHVDSPYFNRLDFYNMTSTDTLTILPHFKTMQQTSEWSCGVVSSLMVLNWYGRLADYNEETLACMRGGIGCAPEGTSLSQMVDIFKATPRNQSVPPINTSQRPSRPPKAYSNHPVCTPTNPAHATQMRLRARYRFASANRVQQC